MKDKMLHQLTWNDVRVLDIDELHILHEKVKGRVLSIQAKREIDNVMGIDTRSMTSKMYFLQKISGTISGHIKAINKSAHEKQNPTKGKLKNMGLKISKLESVIKALKDEKHALHNKLYNAGIDIKTI